MCKWGSCGNLVLEDDTEVDDGQHVARCVLRRPPVRDVRATIAAVVHVGWVTEVGRVYDLTPGHQALLTLIQNPGAQ